MFFCLRKIWRFNVFLLLINVEFALEKGLVDPALLQHEEMMMFGGEKKYLQMMGIRGPRPPRGPPHRGGMGSGHGGAHFSPSHHGHMSPRPPPHFGRPPFPYPPMSAPHRPPFPHGAGFNPPPPRPMSHGYPPFPMPPPPPPSHQGGQQF